MIYVRHSNAKETNFLSLLKASREKILNFLSSKTDVSPTYFETVVFEQMKKSAKGTIFAGKVRQTGTHDFPDIVANKYFGVEVKMTENDHWTSTGNSILESSRIDHVERIYIMFGKFGGVLDIRYRLYQDCLPEIRVTHSPRYRIDMELPLGESIFNKIGIDYDVLRKDKNSIQKIKKYYRKKLKPGEELWWIDQESGDKAVSPIIRPYRDLSAKERESIIVEAMILFPEIFGTSPTKFERVAVYLIAEYNAVSANLRDHFTAGGTVKIKVKTKTIIVPRLIYNLKIRAKAISNKIEQMDISKLIYYWNVRKLDQNRLAQWKKFLDKKFVRTSFSFTISDVFNAGLS